MRRRRLEDVPHPGMVLNDFFMWPWQISQNQLARHIGVPPRRINEIVLGKRSITVDTALRLGAAFLTGPRFWMKLQMEWDLAVALRKGEPEVHGVLGTEEQLYGM